ARKILLRSARHQSRHRRGRVRLDHGAVRGGQIIAPAHSWDARSWLGRRIFFQRNRRSSFESKGTRGLTQRADRFRLSTISFARRPDRLRKSRDPTLLSESEQDGTLRHRRRYARSLSDRGEKGFVSAPTLGRTATARRCRARNYLQSENDSGGRADRKSSLQPGGRDHGVVQEIERGRHHNFASDTLGKKRRLQRSHYSTARWLDRRRQPTQIIMILDSLTQDIRVGFRILLKDKVFLLLSIIVLALGIGGAMTQFAVVNAIVLRGFSFPHPEQLVSVGLIDPKASDQNNNFGNGNIPATQDYEDIKAAQKSFTMMACYLNGSTINVTYKNNPQRYTGAYVTDDIFKIIGVTPALGRDFTAEDNKAGSPKTAILGDKIWRRDFNADPNIVGQSVIINGKAATIIGVMPPGFEFPISEELWTPLYNEWPPTPRGELFLGANSRAPAVMGRLKPGVTLDQANAEMIAIARNIATENPKTNQNFTSAAVLPLINFFTGVQLRQIVWAMLGAVVVVLLIACVNVMNMQFGRAALRAKELAIRGALGATRWRLVRQMLTESLVVAIFGAVAGSMLALWGTDMFDKVVKAAPFPPPYWWRFTIDGRVLAFTLAITLVATVVSGLLPAFLSSRGNAAEVMKEGGRGNSSRLVNVITRVLVVGQIALTAALLIAATLQIKSIRNQTKLDYGYDENGLYAARLALMEGPYPSEDSRREFFT